MTTPATGMEIASGKNFSLLKHIDKIYEKLSLSLQGNFYYYTDKMNPTFRQIQQR